MMTAVNGTEYAMGSFAGYEPDDNNICRAATLTESNVTIGPKKWVYKWSNVEFITQPLMNSIHFGGDLTRTEDDCSVDLKVSAVYPVIYCGTGKKMEIGRAMARCHTSWTTRPPARPTRSCVTRCRATTSTRTSPSPATPLPTARPARTCAWPPRRSRR